MVNISIIKCVTMNSILKWAFQYLIRKGLRLKLQYHQKLSHLFFRIEKGLIKKVSISMKFKIWKKSLQNTSCIRHWILSRRQLCILSKNNALGHNWTNNRMLEYNCLALKWSRTLLSSPKRKRRKEKRKNDSIFFAIHFLLYFKPNIKL